MILFSLFNVRVISRLMIEIKKNPISNVDVNIFGNIQIFTPWIGKS